MVGPGIHAGTIQVERVQQAQRVILVVHFLDASHRLFSEAGIHGIAAELDRSGDLGQHDLNELLDALERESGIHGQLDDVVGVVSRNVTSGGSALEPNAERGLSRASAGGDDLVLEDALDIFGSFVNNAGVLRIDLFLKNFPIHSHVV